MSRLWSAILPVIDLQQGRVVRGVAGNRDQYQPIHSQLSPSSAPADVASAMSTRFGFRDIYLADLDAIAGAVPATEVYADVAAVGLQLWVDAGTGQAVQAEQLASANDPVIHRVIVGLESLASRAELQEILDVVGTSRTVFSLDLRDGQPMTHIAGWTSAPAIVDELVAAGIGSLIVLDLSAVGVANGPATIELCSKIRHVHADLELISGGGVRGAQDVHTLLAAGCQRVLVSSALHNGALKPS